MRAKSLPLRGPVTRDSGRKVSGRKGLVTDLPWGEGVLGKNLNVCQTWQGCRGPGWEQPLPAAQQASIQPSCPWHWLACSRDQGPHQAGGPVVGGSEPRQGMPVKPLSEEGHRCPRKHGGLAHMAPS